MDKILIGSHIGMGKPDYLLGSVEEAFENNENCFMVYTGSPQTFLRTPLEKLKISEA
jgi:deoxyribonuclease-4